MEYLNVFIDTSSLPKDPARLGAAFDRLCHLAEDKVLKIFLSEVVIKEWKSHFEEDFSAVIRQADISLAAVLKHPWAKGIKNHNVVENAKSILSIPEEKIIKIADKQIKELLSKMKAETLLIRDLHGRHIIKDYFKGRPPFQHAKNRDDFPDAFIFQSVTSLIAKLNCHVPCNRNHFSPR